MDAVLSSTVVAKLSEGGHNQNMTTPEATSSVVQKATRGTYPPPENHQENTTMNQRQQAVAKVLVVLLAALGIAGCASIATKEVVATKEAPAAIGPYSQAIKFGNMLFLAGQISIDPKTNQLNTGSIEEQTKLVLDNLKAVLAANGMTMDDVVSTTVFLKDLNEFGKMNAIYGSYFKDKPPARATVQVARLPRDVLVEISAIAAK
jgi:2-iminobutanoate/2-iminopropanoate deaminase